MTDLIQIREKLKPFKEQHLPSLSRVITHLNMISTDHDLDIFLENSINSTLENLQALQYQILEIDLKLSKLSKIQQP